MLSKISERTYLRWSTDEEADDSRHRAGPLKNWDLKVYMISLNGYSAKLQGFMSVNTADLTRAPFFKVFDSTATVLYELVGYLLLLLLVIVRYGWGILYLFIEIFNMLSENWKHAAENRIFVYNFAIKTTELTKYAQLQSHQAVLDTK